jgi:hypothetical protein
MTCSSVYWTFVPIVKTACGTLTESDWAGFSRCDPPKNIPNTCEDQLQEYKAPGWGRSREVRGIIFMVLIDCFARLSLPDEKQDTAYSKPGVKLSRH